VCGLAREAGWEFGAPSAGHLVGHFPHEHAAGERKRFSRVTAMRSGFASRIQTAVRHWILEIHFADKAGGFGGFFEQLLTIGAA
jgi:Xaa-Pro dipeptidase